MITSNLLSLPVIPFPMLRPVFCTVSYMGCCLLSLCLDKASLGTFFSWRLMLFLFLFLTCADHLPAWQKLYGSLLHSWCLCFPQIQRKTLKQSSEEAWICFFSPRGKKKKKAEGRKQAPGESKSSAQIAAPGFLCSACVLADGLSTHCTDFFFF